MKKVFLLIAVTGMMLTSCKKCKDCEMKYEMINGAGMSEFDELVQSMGYSDMNAYMSAQSGGSAEMCSDDLTTAESYNLEMDIDMDGTKDYRMYYDCK